MTETTLPKRHEIPTEMTWDLTLIYERDQDWERDFQVVEDQIAPLSAMQGTLHNGWSLLNTLQKSDEVGKTLGRLYSYASLKRSEDNAVAESQGRVERVKMLGTRLASATAFIEPEILELEENVLAGFVADEPGLQLYDYYLQKLQRRRAHIRSAEVEDVLAQAYEATSGSGNVYKMFGDADLKFPDVVDGEGKTVELTHGRYIKLLESDDRTLRENGFKTMHNEYAKWRNTLAANLASTVKSHVFSARVRHYDSALNSALDPDEIPTDVYTNLISTVRERLPVLHRYLRLRKKLLKLDELQLWDLYVPMVPNVEKEISYEQAEIAVKKSLLPMGESYNRVLDTAFSSRWIDVMENEGKTSGAFSNGSYTTPPYILLNWQNNLNNAFTLTHELGHSLHSYHARETQPYVYAGYTIFVAEVASTLNEALLTQHLQKEARDRGDRALQLSLLNSYAERFRTTLFRQTMFAEFEYSIHATLERGEALTAEGMSEMYLALNQDFYGAEVRVDDSVAIEWARIPHFYYDFYVYQYATGISAAAALSKQILEEGEPAVARYIEFLRGGGSDTSINLLRGAGVDMATPTPIHQALDVFDSVIAQMEALAE